MDPLDYPSDVTEDEADEETYAVRPYAVTGGRTRTTTNEPLPVEALVQSLRGHDDIGLTPERRKILELTRDQYLSVAELSAHVKLPVGIMRVLISDMSDSGNVRIHGAGAFSSTTAPATSLSVLESVLNGISSL
ncbi:DUF742 domain-containing protein [Angustibacter luteus]|uniref:DUF742 domain-containing protein n=1 Tax=Angustibacter luteus TaxID=658456 RepID=A0ABW1JF70_9ACTN